MSWNAGDDVERPLLPCAVAVAVVAVVVAAALALALVSTGGSFRMSSRKPESVGAVGEEQSKGVRTEDVGETRENVRMVHAGCAAGCSACARKAKDSAWGCAA